MVNTPDSYREGYRVFVRTVSGLIIFVCVLYATFRYVFHVAIAQAYSPEYSNTRDLELIGLAIGVACYFTLSIWRGKFFWFIGATRHDT